MDERVRAWPHMLSTRVEYLLNNRTMNMIRRCSPRRCVWLVHLVALAWATLTTTGCQRTAEDVVHGFADYGHVAPYDADVRFIEQHLPDSLAALKEGLTHSNARVRCNTAHVIEKLGGKARQLSADVRAACGKERSWNVRSQLARCFYALGDNSQQTLTFLRSAFASEEHRYVRVSVAGSLVALSDADTESEAWSWLLLQLRPTDPPKKEDYDGWRRHWDLKCAAAFMSTKVTHEKAAVSEALGRLIADQATPDWIKDALSKLLSEMEEDSRDDSAP